MRRKGSDDKDPNFLKFWASYPRKIGVTAAWKAWQKLTPDDELTETILASIEEHRRCRNWRDGFIPLPTTFLNQGRYLDELGPDDYYQAKL